MRDEPAELPRGLVASLLERYWALDLTEVSYAPVGFGSHHWRATDRNGARWFVTLNDIASGGNWLGPDPETVFAALTAAAGTTRALADHGYRFVLAAVPDQAGALVRRVSPGWAMQVFPYVEGARAADSRQDRPRLAAILGRLHAAAPPPGIRRWDGTVPGRAGLLSALDDLATPWGAGPYAERTHALLRETGDAIRRRVRRYDELAAEVAGTADRWVVTHGEPHSANVLRLWDGRMLLVDWDTVALAPRERDLAHVLDGTADTRWAYRHTAGPVAPGAGALELFTLWWALAEIGGYVQLFRYPHADSADSAESWRNLCRYARSASSACG